MRYRQIFVVHRIDTQTSGVVVFAKRRGSAAELSALFATRTIRKTYLAVIEGELAHEVTIESPIGGRDAHTVVRPLRAIDGTTLVEADIRTGRTHQIRVHLQSIQQPVVGDKRYGSTLPAARMLLHAWKIDHPFFGSELVAPPPADFPPL